MDLGLNLCPRPRLQGPAQRAREPRRPLGQPRVLCQVGPQLLPALHLGAEGYVRHGARGGRGLGLPCRAVPVICLTKRCSKRLLLLAGRCTC